MDKDWFAHIFYLCVVTNKIYADGVIHTLVIFKHPNHCNAHGFSFKPKVLDTYEHPNPEYDNINHNGITLKECINRMKEVMGISGIPNSNIFIQVFLEPDINPQTGITKFLKLDKCSYQLINEFLILDHGKSVKKYNNVDNDILIYAEMNIDLEHEMITTPSMIIYRKDFVLISFVVDHGKRLLELTTYEILYKDKPQTVAANTFLCVTPLQVSHIIYSKLIQGSNNINFILHPCMPTNSYFVFQPNNNKKQCVRDFGTDESTKFIGVFNLEKCQNYIKEAITQEILRPDFMKKSNFVDTKLPLLEDNRNILGVFTTLLKHLNVNSLNRQAIKDSQQKFCILPNDLGSQEGSYRECLEIILLEYLIYEILGYRNNLFFLDSESFPEKSNQRFINTDPRIGPLVKKINFPSKSEMLTSVTSTTDILSTRTANISTADYSKVETSTADYSKVETSTADYSKVETSTTVASQTGIAAAETSITEILTPATQSSFIYSTLATTAVKAAASAQVIITAGITTGVILCVFVIAGVSIMVYFKCIKSSDDNI